VSFTGSHRHRSLSQGSRKVRDAVGIDSSAKPPFDVDVIGTRGTPGANGSGPGVHGGPAARAPPRRPARLSRFAATTRSRRTPRPWAGRAETPASQAMRIRRAPPPAPMEPRPPTRRPAIPGPRLRTGFPMVADTGSPTRRRGERTLQFEGMEGTGLLADRSAAAAVQRLRCRAAEFGEVVPRRAQWPPIPRAHGPQINRSRKKCLNDIEKLSHYHPWLSVTQLSMA
jgi:hypothetical protein